RRPVPGTCSRGSSARCWQRTMRRGPARCAPAPRPRGCTRWRRVWRRFRKRAARGRPSRPRRSSNTCGRRSGGCGGNTRRTRARSGPRLARPAPAAVAQSIPMTGQPETAYRRPPDALTTPPAPTPRPQALAAIDLDAIAHNVAVLRERGGDTPIMAVVKADGYGHGALEVSRAMLASGVRELGVCTIAEALALRAGGVTAPILSWLHTPDVDFAPA